MKYKGYINIIKLQNKLGIYENKNWNNEDYIKTINELKEIIKMKDNKIKLLEEELNKYKSNINFNIELKEPKYKINYHKGAIKCSTIL